MSYDLLFRTRDAAPPPRDGLVSWFSGRRGYELSEGEASYTSKDTGTHFLFAWGHEQKGDAASFNMGFARAHTWALEAEPEVKGFVAKFGLLVTDPQEDGMGRGEYDTAGFHRGWTRGNEVALGYEIPKMVEAGTPPLSMPQAKLAQVWKWNSTRAARQAEAGDAVHVPAIRFVVHKGRLRTLVAWKDGRPSLLPEVELVELARETLVPKSMFVFAGKPDTLVVEATELRTPLSPFAAVREPMLHRKLDYTAVPDALAAAIRALPKRDDKVEPVAAEDVLDGEMVMKFKPKRA